ncbi:DUF927 domain-containing protein [Sphingobium sp. CAP-1]|uniref:DUF927 domain-containing protein n=1 Tax=Sphingobium sp. CAP-1 TaxID=2676077 RepID=UPI0018AD2A5D|nr:DUF927 domain-containing protein [Sphingobium sp. CAP-1]
MTKILKKKPQDRPIKLRGRTSPNGIRWMRVRQGKREVWIRYSDFMTDPQGVKALLAKADIILIGNEWSEFLNMVRDDVRDGLRFKPANIAEQSGWTNPIFALPNGIVVAPNKRRGHCAFQPELERCESSGTLDEWLKRVAEPLAGHMLGAFLLMAMFLPPLLKLTHRMGNFGFELIGRPGRGKSTLLEAISSVIGPAVGETPYWQSCNTTVEALERKLKAHSDLPLLLDDATSFAGREVGAVRAKSFKQFVFNLAQGETKDRWNGGKQFRFRTIYIITSNLSLAEVTVELAKKEAAATMDRLLSFDIDLRPHGAFDHVPSEYANIRAFTSALKAALAVEYGTAMPHFLQVLVKKRIKGEQALSAQITKHVEDFIATAQADQNDGSEGRVAEAFGLVLAAGRLAKYCGVLPADLDCEAITLAAYRLHMASASRLRPSERLLAYAKGPDIVDMEELGVPYLSRRALREASGVFRVNRDGVREFLMERTKFEAAFPDHRIVLNDERVSRWLQRGGRHIGVKREVRKGDTKARFYVFHLPDT